VEAFHDRSVLPPDHRSALGRAALIRAATEAGPIEIARVFDSYHPVAGGEFSADRPTLSRGDEMKQVARYLDSGALLLATEARRPIRSTRRPVRWCRSTSAPTADGSGTRTC
jgi:hypothetical protein